MGSTMVLFFLLLVFADPLTAEAYIDPGTGSIIVQAIVASIAVVGFYFRAIFYKIRNIFRNFLGKDKESNTDSDLTKSDKHE
jgi:hypothetical protein